MSSADALRAGARPVVSVIVPSRLRIPSLERCLRALAAQSRVPDEVVIGLRSDDVDSARAIERLAGSYPAELHCACTQESGVVAAMNAALSQCRADSAIIALTDDDTEPRPDWLRVSPIQASAERAAATGSRSNGETAR